MRIASLVAILLVGLSPAYPASNLSGIWTLNTAKSNFGTMIPPEQLVVRLERTGSRLATWRFTTDPGGQHLAYREYTLEGKRRPSLVLARLTPVSIVFPKESAGATSVGEKWRVSKKRLVIQRSITAGPRTVRQRLVLEPSTSVQGTNQIP